MSVRTKMTKIEHSPLPIPKVAKWYGFAALSFLLTLMLLAYAAWSDNTGPFQADRLWVIFALSISILLLCCLLRRAMLERNAYLPGSVDVQELVDATPPETKPLIQDLTSQFRKLISETDLHPPTVLPAEAPPEHFLDLLGDVDLEPKRILTSLLRLFSRLRPKVAYRVRGVLRCRAQKPHYGMTVTVTSFIRGCRSTEVWAATWEQVVREAGYWVMASILPVTRQGKEPPWADWWGKGMPSQLFALYQEAKELSSERKFDEALERLYAALRRDPMNRYLRIEIAGIQESMGLYLDALETYHAALTIDGQDTDERNLQLWAAPWSLGLRLRQRRCLQRPGVLNARYRYAVVLGTSEHTAAQWCHADTIYPRRMQDHKDITRLLTPAFTERYWPVAKVIIPELSRNDARAWLEYRLSGRGCELPWVRLIFQLASAQELRRLVQDHPLRLPGRHVSHNPTGLLPTKPVLKVLGVFWAPLRIAWAHRCLYEADGIPSRHRLACEWKSLRSIESWGSSQQPGMCTFKKAIRREAYVNWPNRILLFPSNTHDVLQLAQRIDSVIHRRKTYDWQAHYGAACVYAIAMNGQPGKSAVRHQLAALAVRELEKSVRCTESGLVTVKRSWLLASDVDLDELRREEIFVSFERETFPHFTPDRSRHASHEQFQIETRMYDRQLLTSSARMMERTWHLRGIGPLSDVHTLEYWFRDEVEIWQAIASIAETRGRNWPDRAKLLRRIRDAADSRIIDTEGFAPRLREWDSVIDEMWFGINRGHENLDFIEKIDEVLDFLLLNIKESASSSPITRSSQWLSEARRAVSRGQNSLPKKLTQQVCAGYAAAWQGLYDLLDSRQPSQSFHDALSRIRTP